MSAAASKCLFALSHLLVLLGVPALLYATATFGPATTPDSAHYLAAAASFAKSREFLACDGGPMVFWPPLYPALLGSVGRLVNGDLFLAARLLGAVLNAVGGLIFLTLARRCLAHPLAILFAAAGWGFSSTLLLMYGAALSEGLFIVTVLLFILAAVSSASALRWMTVMAAVAAACMTRYIGVSLCAVFVTVEWLRTRSWRATMRAGLACGVALLPLALWMLRNSLAAGGAERPAATVGVLGNAHAGLDTITQFLFPAALPFPLRGLALAGLLGLAAWRYRRNTSEAAAWTVTTTAVTVGWYLILMLALARLTYVDVFDFRLMSPVFAPLLLLTAYALDGLFTDRRRAVRLAGMAFMALSLGLAAQRSTSLSLRAHRDGPGMYTSREWREDAGLKRLALDARNLPVLSNEQDLIQVRTGLLAAMLPLPSMGARYALPDQFALHWRKSFWRMYTVDLAFVRESHTLTVVAEDERSVTFVAARKVPVVELR